METIAEIVARHAAAAASSTRSRRPTRASPRTPIPRCSSRCARRRTRSPTAAALDAEGPRGKPLYGVPFARQGQYRRRRACRPPPPVPPSPMRPSARPSSSQRLEAAGAIVDRQDQPRPVRDRPRRRALALWRRRATRCAPISFPAARAPARRPRSAPGSCPFSLGTDTAGSGRVPAALNGIVGLKPTLGALSATRRRAGLPHARHDLDFRARRRRRLRRVPGRGRLRRRRRLFAPLSAPALSRLPPGLRIGVAASRASACSSATPRREARLRARRRRLAALGATIVEFDIEPFAEVARLLYEGPWVAERYAATKPLIETQPGGAASRDARDHRGRAQVRRGRGVRGDLQARRRCGARPRRALARVRRHAGPDHAAPLHASRRSRPIRSRSIRSSGPTPISSTCSISRAIAVSLGHARATACPRA